MSSAFSRYSHNRWGRRLKDWTKVTLLLSDLARIWKSLSICHFVFSFYVHCFSLIAMALVISILSPVTQWDTNWNGRNISCDVQMEWMMYNDKWLNYSTSSRKLDMSRVCYILRTSERFNSICIAISNYLYPIVILKVHWRVIWRNPLKISWIFKFHCQQISQSSVKTEWALQHWRFEWEGSLIRRTAYRF